MERYAGLLGIPCILGLAWLLSSNRRSIRPRTVIVGVLLQFLFALFILKTAWGQAIFIGAKEVITRLLGFTDIGSKFLFGSLQDGNLGVIFAIHVLPTIIFFSSLMSVLYHLGVMQLVVRAFAWVMARFMGTSGAESLSCAANIFVGQTEAPLVIRPYVNDMTLSELNAVMVGGFATVAGGVMAAYVRFGIDAGHLMSAAVMSAPAALVVAKLLVPETGHPKTAGRVELEVKRETVNVIDAAATGAGDGLKLALNVGAMLLAFIALIALVDFGLGKLSVLVRGDGAAPWNLAGIFGVVLAPVGRLIGVPAQDAAAFGGVIGAQISVNEFVAYIKLGELQGMIHPRTHILATYALCGFANFSSVAIQIGGIGGIAPARKADLARLGLKAMLGGVLACWMTASIAGLLVEPTEADWKTYHDAARAKAQQSIDKGVIETAERIYLHVEASSPDPAVRAWAAEGRNALGEKRR